MLNYYNLYPETQANITISEICSCVLTDNLDQLISLVNQDPFILCMKDSSGLSAFHYLATNPYNDFVEGFFEFFDQVKEQITANPMNAISGELNGIPLTPLSLALFNDNLLVIQKLLQRGAQLDPLIIQRLVNEKNLPRTVGFFKNRENFDFPEYDLITHNIPEQIYPEPDSRRQNYSL